ncbi:MAG: hypothetical protein OJF49_000689 [Ktedonobacterales bacterium]|jgi:hypothetical protein|nr:MAG: hypothetical protein OJF49_000689 [Ktedonobacterales bacterium]
MDRKMVTARSSARHTTATHPALFNGVLFGVPLAIALCVAAVAKIRYHNPYVSIAAIILAALVFLLAGYRTARRGGSVASALLAAILAALISLGIGAAVDLWLVHAYIGAYLTWAQQAAALSGDLTIYTPNTLLNRESQMVLQSCVTGLLASAAFGALGGILGREPPLSRAHNEAIKPDDTNRF